MSVVVDAVKTEEPVIAVVCRPREGDVHFALAAGYGFDEFVRALHHEVLVGGVVANVGIPRATELEEAEIALVCFVFNFLFHFLSHSLIVLWLGVPGNPSGFPDTPHSISKPCGSVNVVFGKKFIFSV